MIALEKERSGVRLPSIPDLLKDTNPQPPSKGSVYVIVP